MGCQMKKELNWNTISHHAQKLTQNGLNTLDVRSDSLKCTNKTEKKICHDIVFSHVWWCDFTDKINKGRINKIK